MKILSLVLLSVSALSLGLVVLGTWVALKRLRKRPRPLGDLNDLPVSILKPLKGVDEGLADNLRSFFEIQYPTFELIFSVADRFDPALEVATEISLDYPHIKSTIIVGDVNIGTNPKVNNLVRAESLARFDLILISDSNVRVDPDYLERVVSEYDPSVGLITGVVAGHGPEGLGAHLDAMYLNTFYARGMNLADWGNKPCAIGKSMLYSRKTAKRFGGLRTLAKYLHEDQMAGEAMVKLGLKIVLMAQKIPQHMGYASFSSFWGRHVRWGRIRKNHAPLIFLVEITQNSLFSATMGALAAHTLGLSFGVYFFPYLSLWFLADLLLHRALAGIRPHFPIFWLIRETLTVPLYFKILIGNKVHWRGQELRLRFGGLVEQSMKS